MYENKTEDILRQEMLGMVTSPVTKSEGTFLWDALSPAANEMAKLYMELDSVLRTAFAQTSYGEYLDRRAGEFGITRKQGNKATGSVVITGTDGTVIAAGYKVMTAQGLEYAVTESVTIALGTAEASVEAMEIGTEYNVPAGYVNAPVASQTGVTSIINEEDMTGGTGIESDEDLLERLLIKSQTPASSGNKYDYQNWALEVDGIGGAKIFPAWNGGGTIKIALIDSSKLPANETLVGEVAANIEDKRPIGSTVTCVAAESLPVHVTASVELRDGYTASAIKADLESNLAAYFENIAFKKDYVSFSHVGSIVLGTEGVDDYSGLMVNGNAYNAVLGPYQVPVLGTVTIYV